jgi:hypothetical protein
MIGAYASLLILLAASLVVGQAVLSFARGARRDDPQPVSWLAPALGAGVLVVIAGAAARLPGEGATAAAGLALVAVLSPLYLRGRVSGVADAARLGAPVIVVTTLAASLPFAIAGHVGVLGAGLVNDDMASHLLIADYVRDPSGFVPSFVRGGYPIGPHSVVVALSELLGAGLVEVFAGFTMALAPLTGLLALGLLDRLPAGRRIVGACLVALPYLGASFLAQGAFKEPLQALILVAFALLLAELIGISTATNGTGRVGVHPIQRVLPLGLLTAAAVFNYSLPGLLWVGAVSAMLLLVRWRWVEPRPVLGEGWPRRAAPYALGVVVVVALASAQEWSRALDFARLEALNPDRFGSDLGNLQQAISPAQALGVWPSGDYGITAAAAGLPTALFYLGGLIALAALGLGLAESARRRRWALPAALAAIAVVWAVTAIFSTPYIAAKALAIASPVVMVLAVRGVLGGRSLPRVVLATAFIGAAALSTFLALRSAAVGPEAHAAELAELRAAVQGEEVLFLGRDDFIAWELRGSGEITGIVTNYYSVEEVRGRFQKGEGGGEKFDVDAVFPRTLDQFRFILATRGGPASSPPPRFKPVVETESYVLYERRGRVGRRKTLDEGVEPGAVLDCETPAGRRVARGRGTAQIWATEPVIGGADRWRPSSEPTHERTAFQDLRLTRGRWLLSLAYDSRRPLEVSSPELGLEATLPANLDFRGPTPYFPVAKVEVDGPTRAEVRVTVTEPNLLARLLRAPNEAHLRQLSATPLGVIARTQRRRACGAYVDWYRAR